MRAQLVTGPEDAVTGGGVRRALGLVVRGSGVALVVVLGLLTGLGWLYVLRGLGWLRAGPMVHDALPLLQLPGYDSQPLVRVIVAWLLAGVVAGLALRTIPRLPRILIVAVIGAALLLLASQASLALARNLRFSDVVWSRSPGFGPLLEALLFAAGCALVARRDGGGQPRSLRMRPSALSRFGFVGDLGLRRGERRDAAEHHRRARGRRSGGARRRPTPRRASPAPSPALGSSTGPPEPLPAGRPGHRRLRRCRRSRGRTGPHRRRSEAPCRVARGMGTASPRRNGRAALVRPAVQPRCDRCGPGPAGPTTGS
jgi:hypothetical protein